MLFRSALREDITATVVCDRHFQIVKDSLKPALTRAEIDSYASFLKNPSAKRSGEFVSSVKNDSKHKKEMLGPLFTLKVGVVSFVFLAAAAVVAKYFLTQKIINIIVIPNSYVNQNFL